MIMTERISIKSMTELTMLSFSNMLIIKNKKDAATAAPIIAEFLPFSHEEEAGAKFATVDAGIVQELAQYIVGHSFTCFEYYKTCLYFCQ